MAVAATIVCLQGAAGARVATAVAPPTTGPDDAPTSSIPQWRSPQAGPAAATDAAAATDGHEPRLVGGDTAAEETIGDGIFSPTQGIVGSDNDVLRVTTTKGPCGPSLTYTDGEQAYFRYQSSQAGPLSIYYPSSRGEVHVRTIDLPANVVYKYTPMIDATNGGTNMYVRFVQPGNHAQAYCAFTVVATTSTLCAWATPMFEECDDGYYETELESCATGRTYWYAGELFANAEQGATASGPALEQRAVPPATGGSASGPPAPASANIVAALWSFENPRVAWNPECYANVLHDWGRARLIGYAPNVSCSDCPSSTDRGGSINLWTQRGSFYQCDGVFQNGENLRVFVRAGQSGPATLYVHHSDNSRTTFDLGRLVAGVTYVGDFTIDDDPPGRQMMYVQQTAMRALDTCSYIVDIPRMCSTLGSMTIRTVPETPIANEPFTIIVSGTSLDGCPPGQLTWSLHDGSIDLDLNWGACSRSCGGASTFWEREIVIPGLPADTYPTMASLSCSGRSEMCDDGVITVVERPKPVFVLLPGVAGSYLDNENGSVLRKGESWPNIGELLVGLADPKLLGLYLTGLDTLRLQSDGIRPQTAADDINAREPLWKVPINTDYYDTFRYRVLDEAWGTFVPCPYDWRLAVDSKVTMDTVTECIDRARAGETGNTQADSKSVRQPTGPIVLVGHSLGGIVARAFVADAARAARVDRVITVGTPYLGAPVMFSRLPTGRTGIKPMDFNASVTAKVAEVYRNAPAFQYLLPSSDYGGSALLYVDGTPVRFVKQIEYFKALGANVALIEKARTLHAKLDDISRDVTMPMHVLASGAQRDTETSYNVVAKLVRRGLVYVPTLVWETRTKGSGDGTVPLVGAMADPKRDVFRPGSAHVCIYDAAALASGKKLLDGLKGHGELLSDSNVFDDVMHLAYGEGPQHCKTIHAGAGVSLAKDAAHRDGVASPADVAQADVPAYEVDIVGAASVLAEDVANGTKVGIDRDGTAYDSWTGAELYASTEGIVRVSFSDDERGGPASIYVVPQAGQSNEFTIRRYTATNGDEQTVEERVRFLDVPPAPAGGRFRLTVPLDHSVSASIDVLDASDHVLRTIRPTHVLRGDAATDAVPPTVRLDVQGSRRVSVAVQAEDSASGVEEVLYSLDGGTSWQTYERPIQLAPGFDGTVQAMATDRAGNTSWPPAEVTVSAPWPTVYLPHLITGFTLK